jgi:N-acyl-D-amino-acid deacylase
VFNILIQNGTVYTGAGGAGEKLDIAVSGDAIAALGHFEPQQAEHVVDAAGMAVAPGFIDVHSHSDLSILANPLAESKVFQGVTTEIAGNCGISAAPLHREIVGELIESLEEPLLPEAKWNSLSDYFELVADQGASVNVATHVGHGNVRALAIGLDEKAASEKQLKRMRRSVEKALMQGALGLSTGLIYPPGIYAGTDEIVACAGALKAANGMYVSHIRSEGYKLIEAVQEAIEIGKRAEVPVHIAHLKASGPSNWSKLDRVFEEIERARDERVEVTCDRYPYAASATWLASVLPDWAQAGGRDAILARLRDPTERDKIVPELRKRDTTGNRWQRVMVASVKGGGGLDVVGLTVAEIAELRGVEPAAALVALLVETDLGASAVFFSMSEENMRRVLKKPYVMIGSDSWATNVENERVQTHPRAYGTFPRVLGRLVREGLFPLAEAVHKMTGLPARTFHLVRRGLLQEGWFADVTVFDPERIFDPATYEDPGRYPVGVECVIVNGRITVQNGKHTGERAGRVLRGTDQ